MSGLSCLVSHSLTILSLLVVARMLDRELQAIELMTLAQAGWKVWTRARQGEKMFTLLFRSYSGNWAIHLSQMQPCQYVFMLHKS